MISHSLVLLAALTQMPEGLHGKFAGRGVGQPSVVEGRVKLTPAEAHEEAAARAATELRQRVERRGRRLIDDRAPVWLPGFASSLTLRRWMRELSIDDLLRVVDSRVVEHDHGSYKSYQARLLVDTDASVLDDALDRLRRRLKRDGELFLGKCGGTIAWWGLLALAYLWFDRLTRGYMTWRLRGLFVGMGLALPGIAFILV